MASDSQIIQEVLRGNRTLFGELVKKYQKKVFAIGFKFFHHKQDAEDFTQEVFIKAYERLPTFRQESSFYTWLFRIAYFHGVSWNRKRRSPSPLPEDSEPLDLSPQPEKLHLRKDALAALQSAISELPDRYRICLELYFSLGMPYQDIANITDIPLGTVKSHVFRAKNQLRNLLTGTIAEEPHDL